MSAPQANAKSGLEVLRELEKRKSTAVVEFVEHRSSLFSLRVARNAFAAPSRSGRFRRRVSIRAISTISNSETGMINRWRMRLDRESIREFVTMLMPGFSSG
jgi:hypothetical protein